MSIKTFTKYYQCYNTCNFGTTRWRKVVKSGGFKFIPSQEPYKAMVPWHEKSVIEGVVGVQNETRDKKLISKHDTKSFIEKRDCWEKD